MLIFRQSLKASFWNWQKANLFEERKEVSQASVSLANKRVVIEAIGTTLNHDELIETINDAGFSASVESDKIK